MMTRNPRPRRLVAALSVAAACLVMTLEAHAARLALVVGNDNYQHATKLRNARNDSAAMGRALQEAGFTASMYSTRKDNRFVTIDFEHVGVREGRLVIPGKGDLLTEVGGRTVLAGVNFDESQVFHLPLAGKPTAADEAWSDWVRADQYTRLEPKLLPADVAQHLQTVAWETVQSFKP